MFRRVLIAASICLASAAAVAADNGAIDRPAPQHVVKPAVAPPGADLVAVLNAMVAAQIALQDEAQADRDNPYKMPRPRPDREHLLGLARSGA